MYAHTHCLGSLAGIIFFASYWFARFCPTYCLKCDTLCLGYSIDISPLCMGAIFALFQGTPPPKPFIKTNWISRPRIIVSHTLFWRHFWRRVIHRDSPGHCDGRARPLGFHLLRGKRSPSATGHHAWLENRWISKWYIFDSDPALGFRPHAARIRLAGFCSCKN